MPSDKRARQNDKPSRYAGIMRSSGDGAMYFGQVEAKTLQDCIDAVVRAGDAILLGRTSDSGALSIRVLSDGATECWYPADASELQELLDGLIAVHNV